MEALFDQIVKLLTTQAGLVGLLIFGALMWQTLELGRERKAHEETRSKTNDLAEKALTGAMQTTETLKNMRETMEALRTTIEAVLSRGRPRT